MEKDQFTQEPIALVVDDEPLIRMDACDIISDAGYRVIEATTADQAFEYLQDCIWFSPMCRCPAK